MAKPDWTKQARALAVRIDGLRAHLGTWWDRVGQRYAERLARRILGAAWKEARARYLNSGRSEEAANAALTAATTYLRAGASSGMAAWVAAIAARNVLSEAAPNEYANWLAVSLEEGSEAERAARKALRLAAPKEFAIWDATLVACAREKVIAVETPLCADKHRQK